MGHNGLGIYLKGDYNMTELQKIKEAINTLANCMDDPEFKELTHSESFGHGFLLFCDTVLAPSKIQAIAKEQEPKGKGNLELGMMGIAAGDNALVSTAHESIHEILQDRVQNNPVAKSILEEFINNLKSEAAARANVHQVASSN